MNIFTAITYRAVILTFLWHLLCAVDKLLAHISWHLLKIGCEMLQIGPNLSYSLDGFLWNHSLDVFDEIIIFSEIPQFSNLLIILSVIY